LDSHRSLKTKTGLGDLLRIHVIPSDPANDLELARVQIPQSSFYLIRSDGHIGLCGNRLEAGSARAYGFAEVTSLEFGCSTASIA
jgi:hypothetical protein